jgi:phage-related protein
VSTHQTVATATAASTGIGRLRAVWNAVLGGIGTIVGIAPHALHHIGLLAGTALVAGTAGTVLFGVVGLAASVPLLWRLKKRFGSWWAPVIGLGVFAVMFSLSAFVIGPIFNGPDVQAPSGDQPGPPSEHSEHH